MNGRGEFVQVCDNWLVRMEEVQTVGVVTEPFSEHDRNYPVWFSVKGNEEQCYVPRRDVNNFLARLRYAADDAYDAEVLKELQDKLTAAYAAEEKKDEQRT